VEADSEIQSPFDCREVVLDPKWGYLPVPIPVMVSEASEGRNDETGVSRHLGWIFYQIPLAQLSLWYYFFILAWFLFIGRPRPAWRKWHLVPLVASAGTVLSAFFFVWVMATKTDSWCLLCLVLHGINVLIFILMAAMWRKAGLSLSIADSKQIDGPAEPGLRKLHVAATLAYVATLCAISLVHRQGKTTSVLLNRQLFQYQHKLERLSDDADFLVNAFKGTALSSIPDRESQSSFGNLQAEHELVIFSDLQCPHCRQFERKFLTEYLPMWKGRIKMTFRHFPLCPDCNETQARIHELPKGVHPQACVAAYALEAAALQGGVESAKRMYDHIHEYQERLSEPDFLSDGLARIAKEIGLDENRFREDMGGDQVRKRVTEDVKAAALLKIKVTPTLFLDRRRLNPLQWGSTTFWRRIAADLLPEEEDADRQTGE
jgi:predicted DsbA family dithiol-disulfide isomerase